MFDFVQHVVKIDIVFQSECLKHILYNLREDRNALSDPIFALGRDSSKVESTSGNRGSEPDSVHQHVAHRLKVLQTLVDAQKAALKKLTHCLREAEVQKANLVICQLFILFVRKNRIRQIKTALRCFSFDKTSLVPTC
jgi:hypothetical protein